MNILFLGDVVAKSGLTAVLHSLVRLKKQYAVDFTIVNGENAALGKGITEPIYQALVHAGADVVTLGNHAFAKKEILNEIDHCPLLVRPANMEPTERGQSYVIRRCGNKKVAVVSMLGQAFMNTVTEEPIPAMQKILSEIKADIIVVDFHAEATSEKILFMYYFHNDVTAVIGTHTHVQTADERVYEGCAFISDAGMCGPYESILGRDIEEVTKGMVHKTKTRFLPAKGPSIVCGALIRIDDDTNRAVSIERIQIRPGVSSS